MDDTSSGNGGGIDLTRAGDVSKREDAGQVVHVRDANFEPAYYNGQPVTITVAGTWSSVYRRTQDAQVQRMIRKKQRDLTAEQLTANRVDLVAACILGWQGLTNGTDRDGKQIPLPFTRENAVLVAGVPWLREQLEEAQQDHASFSRPDSTS